MRNSEFPFKGDYTNACLANLNLKNELIERIHAWSLEPKDMLIFLGTPGTGKTYFCAALYHLFTEQKKHVQILNEMDFLHNLRNVIGQGHDPVYEIHKIGEQPFVILDDMGSGRLTEWQQDMLFTLLDKRSENRLPTIITSNHFLADIKSKFEPRFYSRIKATRNLIIELRDTDLRDLYK